MDVEFLTRHWGLVVAAALLAVVAFIVTGAAVRQSRFGRLRERIRAAGRARGDAADAERLLASREKRLARLQSRADKVKPREIDQLRGLCEDARSLVKIRSDRLMVAENRLRTLICDEYPPNRHATLRQRYLPGDVEQGRPLTS